MLIDTHAHLWFPDYYPASPDQSGYYNDLEEVIKRAQLAGVEKMIVPGTDALSSKKATELAKKYPGTIYAAMGVHPEEILGDNNRKSSDLSFAPLQTAERSELWNRSDLEGVVAVGEIGTDASTEELKNCMDEQKALLRTQCEIALEHDLPVIIHTRNSLSEALDVLDNLKQMPKGQFHCFSHDEDGVKQVLTRGFYVSFCGNITWSKRVARLVNLIPSERLLLETDSPLMVPRDKKGYSVQWVAESSDHSPIIAQGSELREPENTRNEPANVAILAQVIADLRGQSLNEVAEITTKNAIRLFRL